jgi:nitroreductase
MEFEELIRERKSTRLFSKKELSQECIDKILESARIAPTAKNTQPFKIYVIKSSEGLKKVDKCSPCRYKAPVVFLICGDEEKSYQKDGIYMYQVDCSIVATHMILEATNIGVDNIFIEYFDTNKIIELFDIPSNLKPVCLLPMGYKAALCPPSPLHKIRKNIDSLVEYR